MTHNRVSVERVENKVIVTAIGQQGPRGTQVLSGVGNPSPVIGLIGDQYINTDNGYLFGPKTADGWGVGVPLGNNDPNDLGQVYTQTSPSSVWNIAHTLAFVPNIVIVDTSNKAVEGDYEYVNPNHIIARFNQEIAGKAYLS